MHAFSLRLFVVSTRVEETESPIDKMRRQSDEYSRSHLAGNVFGSNIRLTHHIVHCFIFTLFHFQVVFCILVVYTIYPEFHRNWILFSRFFLVWRMVLVIY